MPGEKINQFTQNECPCVKIEALFYSLKHPMEVSWGFPQSGSFCGFFVSNQVVN